MNGRPSAYLREADDKKTQLLVIMPATFPRTPIQMSQMPQAMPARVEAHLVIEMTPLFWLKVVFGIDVARLENIDESASARRPPCTDFSYSMVSIERSLAS
jgi:hypothetical protein